MHVAVTLEDIFCRKISVGFFHKVTTLAKVSSPYYHYASDDDDDDDNNNDDNDDARL